MTTAVENGSASSEIIHWSQNEYCIPVSSRITRYPNRDTTRDMTIPREGTARARPLLVSSAHSWVFTPGSPW